MIRARTVAIVAIAATVGLLVGACLSPLPPPQTSSSVPPATSAVSIPSSVAEPPPTLVPGELTELARPWMPPWSGPNVPPEIAERAGHRFCGVELGREPFDRVIRECILREVEQGRNIEFARIETTIEGDLTATIFGFEPVEPPAFTILADLTQDAFGAKGWSVTICDALVSDPATMFRFTGCLEGPTFPLIDR